VLVNNAGIVRYGRFEEVPQVDSELIVDVSLKGVIHGCYAALPYLRGTPGSAIVNIASSGAFYGGAELAVYCATKFGVRGLSEALDAEFAAYGVKVACVMPWFTESGMIKEPGVGRNASIKEDFGDQGFHGPEVPAGAIWKAVHGKALHFPVGGKARMVAALARFAPGLIRSTGRKRMTQSRIP
jgi:short-subunit dehydrogenase